MEKEVQQFKHVKKYLEGLGYSPESILFEYPTISGKHVDIVVYGGDGVLIAIEVKSPQNLNINSLEEIEYNPQSRKLQKEAQELKAKYFILSNGKEHLWMRTSDGGRPEIIDEVRFDIFNIYTSHKSQYVKEVLNHVVEFLRNFPITGDNLFDTSIVFYSKIVHDSDQDIDLSIFIRELFSANHLDEKQTSKYLPTEVLRQALERLDSINFIENKLIVIEFIDSFFESTRREWNVPRWLGDLMVKVLNCNPKDEIVDLFTRNGVITSAAYSNGLKNVTSYYANHNELYWIKIQQLLTLGMERNIRFEPSLLSGRTDFLHENVFDGILLAPPFNLKFQHAPSSVLYDNGVRDSTSIFIEFALKALKPNGKLVAIIPDSFLSSDQFFKVRKYFLAESEIEAIISLPSDSFKPFSGVKTSIVLFVKGHFLNKTKTFLASIEESPKGYVFDSFTSTILKETLDKLVLFHRNIEFTASKSGFSQDILDPENFHFSKYWLQSKYNNPEILEKGYVSVPLKELVYEIERGGAMVSDDEKGDIPYIGPASIRSMRLIKEELSYTSRNKIPKKTKKVESGEVVINAIGTHRGNAALVTSDFDGMPINKHIISLKANSNLIIPKYLALVLNSKFVQKQFYDRSTGTVIPSLNLKIFGEIIIPVPSLEVQKKIADDFFSLADQFNQIQEKLNSLQSELNYKLSILGKEEDNL